LKSDYKQLKQSFGTNLKKIRKNKKLSLLKLAAKCDLDDSQISKIEHGVWDVQLSTIFELAKGLEVEPKDLLDFDL
jgi:transcriptional regulator with XRE-family HTH domain